MKLTIEEILKGRSVGRLQSVGPMQVIPILGEDDDSFAAPDIEAGTSDYGFVRVRNDYDKDTIVPPGSAWVVKQAVQDHAIGSGALVAARSERVIDRAMCIQQTQPGLIRIGRHEMAILPAGLRVRALQLHDEGDYSRLWSHIIRFKTLYGLEDGAGNLVDFLRSFRRELDEFVAEFEVVPEQVGAIVLINGQVAGIEVAPSTTYWEAVWVPLIRVCYGALALRSSQDPEAVPPSTRSVLQVEDDSLAGIRQALAAADAADQKVVESVVISVAPKKLEGDEKPVEELNGAELRTVQGRQLIGQIVTKGTGEDRFKFASLVATKTE